MVSFVRRRREALAVAALLLIALVLRLYQFDWDHGHLYHPDERYILMTTAGLSLSWPPNFAQLLSPQSTLDPHGFAYGTFAFYLLRLISAILAGLSHLGGPLQSLGQFTDATQLRLIGRPISALFDTGTVLIIYLIGKRLYGMRIAFLGAAFVTFSVTDIQLSHFYATDTIMTCLVLAAVLASVVYLGNGRPKAATWAGIFAGLALSTKASAAVVLAPVVMAYVLRLCATETPSGEVRWRLPSGAEINRAVSLLVTSAVAGIVVFLIAEPYAVIDFKNFVGGFVTQSEMARGIVDFPYTRQYHGRLPYLYFLRNLVLFAVGVPLGLAMIGGWIYVIIRAIRWPRPGELLLLSFVIPYFAITGNFYAKFMRYMLPITPLLALFAAVALVHLVQTCREWRRVAPLGASRPGFPPLPGGEGIEPILAPQSRSVSESALPELVDETLALDSAELALLDGGAIALPGANSTVVEENPAGSLAPPDAPEERPGTAARPGPGEPQGHARLAAFAGSAWPTTIARVLVGIVLGFSVFYSLAYDHMYASPTTPVEGSLWLYHNAPQGSVIATQSWEEGMPVPIVTSSGVEDASTHHFQNVTMPMYDPDNAAKLNTMINNLEAADYIVFFSNRLYGTVPRLPERYPMSRRYYVELFGGKLGFKLVAAFDRYPNLAGVAFVDDTLKDPGLPIPPLLQQQKIAPLAIHLGHADESFSVYDHQKVLIFQKVQPLSAAQLRALIGPPPSTSPPLAGASTPHYKPLVYTPAQEAAVQSGGTFRDLFDRSDIFNHFPLVTWVVMIVLIALASLPIGFLVFRFLPDRGYLVSKTLGILALVWLNWIIVCLGITEATRPAVLVILAIYLVLGALAGFLQRWQIFAFARAHWRLLGFEEAFFWVAFFYDVYIRSLDPDLWHPTLGGEKPMDLAFFTAAARSPIYPPYDPWFSGGYLNYYYFGQIIDGTLTKITGVLPTTSYNIVIPLLFALTVGGAFTVALALVHRGGSVVGRSAVVGGVIASFMVCVLGNLGGFVQLVIQIASASTVKPGAAIPGLAGLIAFADGAANLLTGQAPFVLRQDWYWASTRMLAFLGLPGTGSINEFPYFTFLFADLHAHLMGLPLTLLTLALGVNFIKSRGALVRWWGGSTSDDEGVPSSPESGDARLRLSGAQADGGPAGCNTSPDVPLGVTRIAALGAAGLAVGALYPTNTWDYPTYLGLMALALVIPWYLARRLTLSGFAKAVVSLAVVVVLSRLLFQPFYAYFQSFYSGVHTITEKSAISWFVMINGLFLAVMISYLLVQGLALYRRSGILRAARLYVAKWDLLPRTLELQRLLVKRWDARELLGLYLIILVGLIVAGAFALGMALTGVLLVLLAGALAIALRRDRSGEDCFLVFLFATGLALAIGAEQVAIDGDVGRMNTVFKFYEQIWVLWGVASAVAVVRTRERLAKAGARWVRVTWAAVVMALVVMTAVYPVVGTISRVSNRFDAQIPPTLDGTAYMDHAVYTDDGHPLNLETDKEAIIWLQDHVNGTPTILEGNRPIYTWGSRMSIYTGLPTVIGWDWHETQQRWGYQNLVQERLDAVKAMYDSPSPELTLSLLKTYDVTYIMDGELEQAFYPTATAKFDSMVGTSLSVVYDHDHVKIYKVIRG